MYGLKESGLHIHIREIMHDLLFKSSVFHRKKKAEIEGEKTNKDNLHISSLIYLIIILVIIQLYKSHKS